MPTFSRRYGYSDDPRQQQIVEDAPSWLRQGFADLLDDYTYVDEDSRYQSYGKPLGIKALNRVIAVQFHEDFDSTMSDSWYCQDVLHTFVMDGPWHRFYDLVEIVARQLRTQEERWRRLNDPWSKDPLSNAKGVSAYRSDVNGFFAEHGVAWRLDEEGLLMRAMPADALEQLAMSREDLETNNYRASLGHYDKALRYISRRPLDPENAIKEIVSALESVARTIQPGVQTLGKAIDRFRTDRKLPMHLLTIAEKLYAYASDEPAVRHGSAQESRVSLADAEFCVHVGGALIRYLLCSLGPETDDEGR